MPKSKRIIPIAEILGWLVYLPETGAEEVITTLRVAPPQPVWRIADEWLIATLAQAQPRVAAEGPVHPVRWFLSYEVRWADNSEYALEMPLSIESPHVFRWERGQLAAEVRGAHLDIQETQEADGEAEPLDAQSFLLTHEVGG